MKDDEWKSRQIVTYYQWVPLILLIMSVMSLLPALLWRFLSRRSGVDVSAVMTSAVAGQQAGYAELRERTVRYVVNQVVRAWMRPTAARVARSVVSVTGVDFAERMNR